MTGAVCSAGGYVFCGDKVLVDLPMERAAAGVRAPWSATAWSARWKPGMLPLRQLKMTERWKFTHKMRGKPLNSEAARWRKAMEDGMTISPLSRLQGRAVI